MATGTRRQAREAALQAIYLMDVCKQDIASMPAPAWTSDHLDEKTRAFAKQIARGVADHQQNLDAIIVKYTENWDMKRMAAIDRCILRLASYELLHELATPVNVVINEALEIAKKYSTEESSKFVNGILDKVKRERDSIKE